MNFFSRITSNISNKKFTIQVICLIFFLIFPLAGYYFVANGFQLLSELSVFLLAAWMLTIMLVG